MVGGRIIEVLRSADRMRLWCMDRNGDERAVYAEQHYGVQPGDQCWWQGGFVYWTPKNARHPSETDIPIKKIGFSFDPREVTASDGGKP